MKKLFTLIVLFLASTGLFNQINAQVPDSILNKRLNYLPDYQEVNEATPDLEFYRTANSRSVKKEKLKSAQACQELLDSIVDLALFDGKIYSGNKYEWGYDADGNKTYNSNYYWDENIENWNGRRKNDSIFNANGDLSIAIINTWDTETRQWVHHEKNELAYDADGNMTLFSIFYWNNETEEWEWKRKQETTHTYTADNKHHIISINFTLDDKTGEWTYSYRNEVNYDSNGYMTLYNSSFWDSTANDWVFTDRSFKYEHAYDENGNRTLSSYYEWNSELGQWIGSVFSNLTESGYDALGNDTMVVVKNWDETLNQWENSTKSESSYTANGLKLQNTTYQWDTLSGDWMAIKRTENSYNEDGVLSNMIKSEWDNGQNMWIGISQQEFKYDAKGNLSQLNSLQIDTISGEWYANAKDEYKYDADNNEVLKETSKLNNNDLCIIKSIKYTFYDVYGNIYLNTVYASSGEGDNLVKSNETEFTYNESGDKLLEVVKTDYFDGFSMESKKNYYYSMHCATVSSIDIQAEAPNVYPNPFSDQLSFRLNNYYKQVAFELFDLQGRKVMSKRVLGSETISTIGLDGGVYIYKLSFDGNMQTGKLIKK